MSSAPDPRQFPQALYVHLPFCTAICTYCDFAVERYAAVRAARYLDALENELRARTAALASEFPSNSFEPRTIFLGGGTPTAFDIPELTRFFEILDRYVNARQVVEFTIEANPGTVDSEKLRFLLAHGVNRLSLGVQSFQPALLQLLGRVHGADQGPEAIALARASGFKNISIDLMHGLPGQSSQHLRDDLERAIALGTDHISAYGLMYEDGTPLKSAVTRGIVMPLTPEEEAAHFQTVMETIERAGWHQYEVSNFARPGFESEHNQIYWRNEAYLGVGVGSASSIGGERNVNDDTLDGYIRGAMAQGHAIVTRERLDADARAGEALMLELRMRRGVDLPEFSRRWGVDLFETEGAKAPTTSSAFPFQGGENSRALRALDVTKSSRTLALERYLREGLMERLADGRIRISRRGLPVSDGILADFV
jgi:oxygen-independent coproporphyrinogen-3 oxidase